MGGKPIKAEERDKAADAGGAASPSAACTRRSMAHRDLRSLEGVIWDSEMGHLRTLDVSYNKLSDGCLSELDQCESLESLILDHNRFQSVSLPFLPKLRFLSLASNQVTDLEELCCNLRARTPELRTLSLVSNPCCPDWEMQARHPHRHHVYRLFVVGHLPKLGRLDLEEVTETEREAADDLLSRISEGTTSLELELSDAPRRRSRHDSTATKPEERKRNSQKEKKEKKAKKKEKKEKKSKRGSGDSKGKAFADPVPEVLDKPAADLEVPDKQVTDEEDGRTGEEAETVSRSQGDDASPRSEGQSQPLPQLRQLLRQNSDWAEQPPPPPPPPIWSDDEEGGGKVRKAKVKVPHQGEWSDDSSASSSDAEMDRVLEEASSRMYLAKAEEPASPPPPPPRQPLPQHYGPHTTVPPPPPPPYHATSPPVEAGRWRQPPKPQRHHDHEGWSSEEDF